MFGRASEVSQFSELLVSGQHVKGMRLFDQVSQDPTLCALVLDSVVMSNSNQSDPSLHTPHGLPTTNAARAMLAISGFPAGVPLLRFITLYSFSLRKRGLSAEDVRIKARSLPALPDQVGALTAALSAGDVGVSGAVLARLAMDRGIPAAAHAVLRYTLNDVGKLGHHLAFAVSFLDAAEALGLPRGLLPIANLGFFLAESMKGTRAIEIPPLEADAVPPSPEGLAEAAETGAFDVVEAHLRALLAARRTDDAVRPLLVAASADPGFLGHTLILANAIRRAAPYLEPSENFHLFWKAYRTLVSRFGYPEFLRLGRDPGVERVAVMNALRASLQHKTPPAELTVRQALEAGVPLDEVLGTIVNAYGHWTVGEKEHTIALLGAAVETARFLGRDEALLPLAVALMRLPF
jgi:hypothetical protein